ncbi:MAG: ATP-dependent metallopeptidase FtsH/Yme1/Tma family protein, partial [Sphaerochaetaceae bacterium]|nr:ATP-dependent metallopeptidase FtsH/Yme1/Tma family protein [Sphaerochaetaceae bacterium]
MAFVLLILPEDLFLGEKIPYSQFVSMVEEGKVESITIYEERVKVRSEGKTYSTSNPDYPTFKEEMLLSGINVEMGTSSLSSALDTVFNILFLAIVAFAIYKALDWYFHT